MNTCEHPPHKVTADILEGDAGKYSVHWCRVCGAYKISHSAGLVPSPGSYTTSWRAPEGKSPYEVSCPKCGNYYGGHATGSHDICCCHMP